jgi:hypothetical protein
VRRLIGPRLEARINWDIPSILRKAEDGKIINSDGGEELRRGVRICVFILTSIGH